MISIHHGFHRLDIVLTITIYGNRDITHILGFHQSCKNRILMSSVTTLAHTDKMWILSCQVFNNLPGFIFTSIIYKQNTTVITNLSFMYQIFKLFKEHFRCDWKDFFFIITGYHYK